MTRPVGIAATLLALAGLWAASNTAQAYNAAVGCRGSHIGLGWIVPGLLNIAWLACVWTLAGGLAAYALVVALRRRQWGWMAGLVAAVAAGIVGTVGADSAASHQAVGAVLGTDCGWFWPWVTRFVAVVLVAVAGLAYTLLQRHLSPV